MATGQCHCGAVKYEASGQPIYQAICHCSDCRRQTGAPMVAWALVPNAQLQVQGETREYASSENGRRHFCPACGTSLFYTNAAMFPDATDVQIATLHDPELLPPQIQVQVAERVEWVKSVGNLLEFERYPRGALTRPVLPDIHMTHRAAGTDSALRDSPGGLILPW